MQAAKASWFLGSAGPAPAVLVPGCCHHQSQDGHVTTESSCKMAAKEPVDVLGICCTSLNCSCNALLSPPSIGFPQVTTEPPAAYKAKACPVDANLTLRTTASTRSALRKVDGKSSRLPPNAASNFSQRTELSGDTVTAQQWPLGRPISTCQGLWSAHVLQKGQQRSLPGRRYRLWVRANEAKNAG